MIWQRQRRSDHAREIKHALQDPVTLCEALGLTKESTRQPSGLMILCPHHDERTPSCSVTRTASGIRVKCFGCHEFKGDALTLIAEVEQLSISTQFQRVLVVGAEIAGLTEIVEEIRSDKPRNPRRRPSPGPKPQEERSYPPIESVKSLWENAAPVTEDTRASSYLVKRRLDPELIARHNLARVIRHPLPHWARFQGHDWIATGHTLVTRAFDVDGAARSVRAARVIDAGTPKRLPPSGYRASGLVLVNKSACAMLRGARCRRVVLVEGEPDFWTHGTCDKPEAVIGIVSGGWSKAFAARLTKGCDVIVRVHTDEAGDRYASAIIETIGERCRVWRTA